MLEIFSWLCWITFFVVTAWLGATTQNHKLILKMCLITGFMFFGYFILRGEPETKAAMRAYAPLIIAYSAWSIAWIVRKIRGASK